MALSMFVPDLSVTLRVLSVQVAMLCSMLGIQDPPRHALRRFLIQLLVLRRMLDVQVLVHVAMFGPQFVVHVRVFVIIWGVVVLA